MSPHDSGVTELLRRASDDLAPDVDRLVSGGISRGRTRQRRARIGTTVASLAVIGVVGVLASVVPRAGDGDSARDPGIATEGPSATDEPTLEPAPVTQGPLKAIPAAQVPSAALSLLEPPVDLQQSEAAVLADQPDWRFVQVLLDGMQASFGLQKVGQPSMSDCRKEAEPLGGSCQTLPGGNVLLTWGPTLADGVTCQGVDVQRPGYDVWATACNAAEGKDSPPLADEPPLTIPQLVTIAGSDSWFE